MIDLFDWNTSSPIIKLHMVVAVLGFGIGTAVMIAKRGTSLHRWMGRGFGIAALATALTSFFIHEINQWGQWSWIHLLSVYTTASVIVGVVAIRRGNMKLHMRAMVPVYLGGFVIAGAFTLMPGRLVFETFLRPSFEFLFSGDRGLMGQVAWIFPLIGITVAVIAWRRAMLGPERRRSAFRPYR